MCKQNVYAKVEKLEAQICRYTREGLKVIPCPTCVEREGTVFTSIYLGRFPQLCGVGHNKRIAPTYSLRVVKGD